MTISDDNTPAALLHRSRQALQIGLAIALSLALLISTLFISTAVLAGGLLLVLLAVVVAKLKRRFATPARHNGYIIKGEYTSSQQYAQRFY